MSNSLTSETDGETVAAEIVLLRAANDRTILIVEGPTDERFFASFVDESECDIVISYGRSHSLTGLAIVTGHAIRGVLAVIDQDFDSFLDIVHNDPNVIVTEDHDIEIAMLKSRAFEKVLIELGSRAKIRALVDAGVDLRVKILEPVHPLGILRLFSLQNGLNLRFDELKFQFLNKKLELNNEDMVREVFNHSRVFGHDLQAVIEFIEDWQAKPHDRWLITCGHDVVTSLGRALQQMLGTQNSGAVQPEQIESRLRLAFSSDDFRATRIFADIRDWEAQNLPFRCLR
jgi:hypothetical protein